MVPRRCLCSARGSNREHDRHNRKDRRDKEGEMREKRRGSSAWHCHVFRAVPYNNARLLCRLYSPPIFRSAHEHRLTLSSLLVLPQWHFLHLPLLTTRSVNIEILCEIFCGDCPEFIRTSVSYRMIANICTNFFFA